MNILFSHSYFLRFDPKQWKLSKPYPPLGTIYAAALMRSAGHNVSLHDTMFVRDPGEVVPAIEENRPDVLVVYDDGFNYLTKMCLTNMREAAIEMARIASERGIVSIVCSSDSTDHAELYLRGGFDYVIRGEGEMTLKELTERIAAGNPADDVPGITFLKNGEMVINPDRPVMRDLDGLPAPAWDLIDIEKYRDAWAKHGRFSLNMATTRGCPYKCNWCAKPIYGNRYNSHSPESKAAEIEMLVKEFGADHIWFCDDIFGLKPDWVEAFSAELKKRKIRVPFMIQSRADLLTKEETVKALAEAGCNEVWLGAESGSQKILDAMDKGITIDQIMAARKLLKKYGIRTAFFLQFGYLGETSEDIEMTFGMLKKALPEDIGVSVSYPLPGTKFHEKVRSHLSGKTNWTDSDDLAMMFRNTHSPEFYKRLHRYVHKRYRKIQSFEGLGNLIKGKMGNGNLKKALSSLYYIPATWVEKSKLNGLKND